MPTIKRFGAGPQTYTFPSADMVQQNVSDNFGNAVPRTTRLPGLDGGFDEFGVDPAPAEIGKVDLGLYLVGTARSEMTALLDALRVMKSWGKSHLYMQPDDPAEDLRWCSARINNIMSPSDLKGLGVHQHVKIIWQVSDPFWYTQGTEAFRWGDGTLWGEGVAWGGDATPQALSGKITDLTVTVGGKAKTLPRIVIECGAGETFNRPKVQRLVGGLVVDEAFYNVALIANDQLIIDCRKASVTENGVAAFDDFTYDHPDFIRLYPGKNTLRVTALTDGSAGSITVKYYEVYV